MTTKELADLLHGAPRRIHLIGVAGSGMSGIAALLLALGHRVSGSDKVDTVEVKRLQSLGLDFHTPQRAADVVEAQLVVYSSAIREGNAAFAAARSLGKPMVRRAEALAALMLGKKGILVAGMHGKTTVSAMTAHVLRAAGGHPSHYVGAEIPILGTNARWDDGGEYFVAEGDESDGTIVLYHPEHVIVLNIEAGGVAISLHDERRGFRSIARPDDRENFLLCRRCRGDADVCGTPSGCFLWKDRDLYLHRHPARGICLDLFFPPGGPRTCSGHPQCSGGAQCGQCDRGTGPRR